MKHLIAVFTLMLFTSLPAKAQLSIRIAMNDVADAATNGEYAFILGFRAVADQAGFITEVYPSNALGTEVERLAQTGQGLIQINLGAVSTPAQINPLLRLAQLPFLFTSYQEFDAVIAQTDLLAHLNAPLQAEGLRLAGFNLRGLDAGFFNRSVPLATLDDLRGLRMRAQDRGQVAIYAKLGVNSTVVDWSEIDHALQSGIVDGYVNPPNSALRAGHTRLLRHYTPAALAPSLRAVTLSEDWYSALLPDQRHTVDTAIAAGLSANRDWLTGWAEEVDERLAAAGVTVTELAEGERARLVQMLTPIHAELLGADGLALVMTAIDEIRGK